MVAPDSPKGKRLNDLVKTLRVHLKPKPLVIAERFKFYKRLQCEEESIAEYSVMLKPLSTHSDFGSFLNDTLRDQLVCGPSHKIIQKKLLAEDKLTFKKACEIAQAMERADRNANELKANETGEVQAVSDKHKFTKKSSANKQSQSTGGIKKNCYHCGGQHKTDLEQRSVESVAR